MINRIVVVLIERWIVSLPLMVGVLFLPSWSLECGTASAAYPDKPVRLMVGFKAGDTTDLLGRLVAKGMEEIFKNPVVVTNKPGAGGALAYDEVRRAKADGYTLGWVTGSLFTTTNIGNVKWDYKALEPIAKMAELPMAIGVRADRSWKTWGDFVSDARKNPGKYKFGHAGTGSIGHLVNVAVLPKDVKLIMVPLGAAERFPALLGGKIDLLSAPVPGIVKFEQAKKMRSLLVSSAERTGTLPNTPTFKEAGINVELTLMYGVFAPRGIPKEVKEKVRMALSKIAKDNRAFQNFAQKQQIELRYSEGAAFEKWLSEHNSIVVDVMRREGLYMSRSGKK